MILCEPFDVVAVEERKLVVPHDQHSRLAVTMREAPAMVGHDYSVEREPRRSVRYTLDEINAEFPKVEFGQFGVVSAEHQAEKRVVQSGGRSAAEVAGKPLDRCLMVKQAVHELFGQ